MTSTRGADCESDSTFDDNECAPATAAQASRMRRGDISAKVTREMRRMLHKAERRGGQPSAGAAADQSAFQDLAESCGFRAIPEEDTSDCEREFESDFVSSDCDDSNSTASNTTCTSCCYSDHELRLSRSHQSPGCLQPASSASEMSHCDQRGGGGGGRGPRLLRSQTVSSSSGLEPRQAPGSKPSKMWKVQSGQTVWERIDPVVDNLGSPRDSSANHVPVEDSLPAKCKKLAMQSSGRSAFRPVIARTQDDRETADSAKAPGIKYKIFMENPECIDTSLNAQGLGKSPKSQNAGVGEFSGMKRIVITKQEHGGKKTDARTGGGSSARTTHRRDSDEAKADKEVEDTFKIMKKPRSGVDERNTRELQLSEGGPRQGGMIHRLREMNDEFRRREGSRATLGKRRTGEENTDARVVKGPSNSSRRIEKTRSGVGGVGGPRTKRSDCQMTSGSHGSVALNETVDELSTPTALPGGRMCESAALEVRCPEDRRHVDYRRNVNSNYEDTENADDICASAFIGQYLYELWKNQCLCDVRIRVGKSSYLAHKIVLAAFSDVFCPNEPQKMPSLCFDIPNSTPDAVYQILLYLYTSEMELTDGILEEVLNAACFMGIWEVICLIKEILSKPTFENFGLYLEIRERQGMSAGLLDFPEIVREHLLELIDTPHFLNLTIEELETLLRDPDIMVESELDIVNVISKWIEYDPFHRMKCAARLLSLVSFDCLPAETLFDIVEEKKHLFDMDAIQVLLEAFKSHALKPRDRCSFAPDREFSRERRLPATNECCSNCEHTVPENEHVRPIDPHVKSFKEIRDQFASRRQTEARRMLPRGNIAKQYVNSHALPYDEKQPPYKGPCGNPGNKPPSRNSGFHNSESPCQPKQCPTANETVKPVREFHLSAAAPVMNVEGPANRVADFERRASVERRNRNVNGLKPPSVGDSDEGNYNKIKPQHQPYPNKCCPPSECSVKPAGSNKSPSQGGWSNSSHPPCKSPNSGWAGAEDEFDGPGGQPGRRVVRRRGDIIRSSCSPGDTTVSDKSEL
ncbi:hypothetical protein Btru_038745 [Bulinus truncatus]|nr:hypothetical protein Btru_038745 [Bulinus truncatus]